MCRWTKVHLHICILVVFVFFFCGESRAQSCNGIDSILVNSERGYKINGDLFVKGKDSLLPATFIYLDSVADFLLKHQNVVLEVICSPDESYQEKHTKLGQNRGIKICDYLIQQKHISKDQIELMGYEDYGPSKVIYKKVIEENDIGDRIQFVVLKNE
jgi:hypothetical protein